MRNPLRRSELAPGSTDATDEIRPCGLCLRCVSACPTGALRYNDRVWSLDLRLCLFCRKCSSVCPNALIAERPA